MTDTLFLGLATLGFSMITVTVAATWYLARAIGRAYGHAEKQVDEHGRSCRNFDPRKLDA